MDILRAEPVAAWDPHPPPSRCRIAHREVFKDRVAEKGGGARLGEEREAGVKHAREINAEMHLPKMGVK